VITGILVLYWSLLIEVMGLLETRTVSRLDHQAEQRVF